VAWALSSGTRCSRPSRPIPNQVFVIAGPSGVGKGSIASALCRRLPNLWLSRSWTTRPVRDGEPADAYVFVDREAFDARIEAGGFLEWAEVFGHRYGTPWPEPPEGHDVLLEIDVQGAGQVRVRHPQAVVVFIEAPSRAAQEARLRGRGDREELIARRLAAAPDEERVGRALADHVVVNDDLSRAIEEVAAILESRRQ
jgi:guanylate kinase